MGLSVEEKRKIYEEEKARIEAEQAAQIVKRKGKIEADESTRIQRITASSMVIALSIALLLLFYIFKHYLAFYQIEQHNGVSEWVRYEILTGEFFNPWRNILTATLALSIIGHIVAIIYDKYVVRQSIIVALNLAGLGTVIYLLAIFPFNFTSLPAGGEVILSVVLRIVIITIMAVLLMVALVNLIKLITRVATRTATY